MPAISSRKGLIDYCLRRLGEPVIEVNVDPDQIEDRVDDTLSMYQEFHSDGTFRNYYSHTLTADEVKAKCITIPESILYVVKMYSAGSSSAWIGSPIAMPMMGGTWHLGGAPIQGCGTGIYGGLQSYVQLSQYLNLIDTAIRGYPLIDFARRQNKLYIWSDVNDGGLVAGSSFVIECYQTVDPDDYPSVYNDMFVKAYLTALIKRQWGQNMSKFEGMTLPGGVTISGRTMLEEANQELEKLKEDMRLEQEVPPEFMVG